MDKCAPLIIGVSKSVYKSYETMQEAIEAYNHFLISKNNGESSCNDIYFAISTKEVTLIDGAIQVTYEDVVSTCSGYWSETDKLFIGFVIGMLFAMHLSKH